MKRGSDEEIIRLRNEGHSLKEIAKVYGVSKEYVGRICRRLNVGGVLSPKATTVPEDPKQYVESFLPNQFSYVSGYSNSDASVTLKCCVCGGTFEMSMGWIRNVRRKNTHCPLCEEEERNRIAEEKRLMAEKRKELAALRKDEKEAEHESKRRSAECEICGETFTTYRQNVTCCSPECAKKKRNRYSSHRKDVRITKEKRIDNGISALGLFVKDGGVCWICGGKCNPHDYEIKDGHKICGNTYPSVDHIVPVCEGGEDSWKNVRLAHRICNSKRYFAEKVLDGQRVCP